MSDVPSLSKHAPNGRRRSVILGVYIIMDTIYERKLKEIKEIKKLLALALYLASSKRSRLTIYTIQTVKKMRHA